MSQPLDITIPGGRITGRHWPGHGRPVLALHGFLDSSAGWSAYASATHRPCVALDLPGFGGSTVPPLATVEAYRELLDPAIASLDMEPILVGHSMGGMLAAYAATAVDATCLLLIAPAGFGRIPLAEWADRTPVRQMAHIGLPAVLANPLLTETVYRLGVSGGTPMASEMRWHLWRNALSVKAGADRGLRTLASFSRGLRAGLVEPPPLTLPTSVVWGARDRIVPPEHVHAVRRFAPHVHVTEWEDVAHHPHVECPERLHRWIEYRATTARAEHRRRRRARRS